MNQPNKKISTGIEPLKTSIRIWWKIDGKRERETLYNTPPTEVNLKQAQATADMIAQQLRLGIFDRDSVFTDSPKRADRYFGHYIHQWRKVEANKVAKISFDTYDSKVKTHIEPYWQIKPIAKITVDDIEDWIYNVLLQKLSTKTVKEILMLWRKIYSYWARHQKTVNDPTQYITLTQADPEDIDPFDRDEIAKILAYPTTPTLHNLYTVMLWSGLSFHELISLAVEDLDLANGCLYVNRSFVRDQYRVTKNRRRKRQVDLLPIVIDTLQSQLHQIKDKPKATINITDRDNKRIKLQTLTWLWYDDTSHFTYSQLTRRWTAHLESCGVRYRPLNNGRHTYASQVLSSGAVTAEWLAKQLGHSNTDMIHRHYGKFIPKDASHIIHNLANALR